MKDINNATVVTDIAGSDYVFVSVGGKLRKILKTDLMSELGITDKVDKVSGKGLSTNDYTDAEMEKNEKNATLINEVKMDVEDNKTSIAEANSKISKNAEDISSLQSTFEDTTSHLESNIEEANSKISKNTENIESNSTEIDTLKENLTKLGLYIDEDGDLCQKEED